VNCNICPRKCDIDREVNRGFCRSGVLPKINIYQLHYGEEPVISGTRGSGTIFFSGCNLSCVYCQNYQISQLNYGKEYSIKELAEIMIELQAQGAHNINLVTPTHFSLQIKEGLIQAKAEGLKIPVVWNSNAYEEVETLKELEGLVDIYLPDFKYANDELAKQYSGIEQYSSVALKAIKEMYYQKGNTLLYDEHGQLERGLVIRHLVLPNHIENSIAVMNMITEEISPRVAVSLMSQYYPPADLQLPSELRRNLKREEYETVVEHMQELGITKGWVQEFESQDFYRPDFNQNHPFERF